MYGGCGEQCLTLVGSFWLVRTMSNLGEDSIEELGNVWSRGHHFACIEISAKLMIRNIVRKSTMVDRCRGHVGDPAWKLDATSAIFFGRRLINLGLPQHGSPSRLPLQATVSPPQTAKCL